MDYEMDLDSWIMDMMPNIHTNKNIPKEIKAAPIQYSKDVDFKTKAPSHKPKIVIEPFCVYRQALNKKNFIKRLKREGIID